MRKTWLLFPAWASVGFLVYACDDDVTNPAKDGGSDAPTATQTTPMPDAGGELDQFVPEMDAGTDAFDAGPQPGPVDVQVVDGTGAPVSGTDVYFNEPSGTVVKVTTDATGHAVHVMLGGGSVALLRIDGTPQNPFYDVTTVLDVQQADKILITPPPGPAAINVATVSGNFTGALPVDGGAGVTYEIDFGLCNATPNVTANTSYTASIGADCIVPGKGISFMARAKDTNGAFVAFAPKTVATVPDGGMINVDIATADWVAVQSKQATFTGTLTTPFTQFQSDIGSPRNGFEFAKTTTYGGATPPATATYYPVPGTFAPNIQSITQENGYFMGTDYVVLAHGVRGPAATTAIVEDLSKNLPRITGLTTGGTIAVPTVSWTAIGTAAVGSTTLIGNHTPDGGPSYFVRWQIVYPAAATTGSVQYPALPAAIQGQIAPDQPWSVDNMSLLASPQLPYSIGHLVPTVLNNGVNGISQAANLIPGLTAFDARLTYIQPNSG